MGVGADAEPLDQLLDLFASDAILASQFFGLRGPFRQAIGRFRS